MSLHTLSVLVEDSPGVLARISALFSRRGYNIVSLAVGPTEREGISRISLVADLDSTSVLEQLVKQLNKLIEVLKVIELEQSAIKRELVLIKVRSDVEKRSQILDTVSLFRAKAVDVDLESVTIECTGAHDKLQALIQMLVPYGIIELVQSGQVALSRGHKALSEKGKYCV